MTSMLVLDYTKEKFEHIREVLDISMVELSNLHSQGNYVKLSEVYDIMLDVRSLVQEYSDNE